MLCLVLLQITVNMKYIISINLHYINQLCFELKGCRIDNRHAVAEAVSKCDPRTF